LRSKISGKRALFALGSDRREAADKLTEIKIANRRGEDLSRFKPERKVEPKTEAKIQPMTFGRYSEIYLVKPEAQALKSHKRDCDFVKHLNTFFSESVLEGGIKRHHLFEYRDKRLTEFKMRNGKPTTNRIGRGEITNELSCLRKILNAAVADEYPVLIPSFVDKKSKKNERLMWRHPGRDRILDQDEESRLMACYPTWLKRLAIFARETALNQGDCMELTKFWIDRKNRLVKLPNGRNKSGQEQTPYLSEGALAILDEIERDRRAGKIASNVASYVFTKDDGSKITKDDVTGAIRRARKKAKVNDFRFHDYRHMAQTAWSIQNVPDAIAMKMAGLASPQMRQRYTNIKPRHVSEFMTRLENGEQKW
jgi:integrase